MRTRLEVALTAYDFSAPFAGAVPTGGTPATVGYYTISHIGAPTFTVQGPNGLNPGLFAIPNHGLANLAPVTISVISGTTAFQVGVTYFVDQTNFAGVTPPSPFDKQNTFYLSATSGGPPIVPADANGAGIMFTTATNATHTIFMQPQRYGESWTVDRVTVQNTSQIKVPAVSVYRGVVSLSTLIDSSPNGIFNTDDLNSPLTLSAGEPIVIQWTGCDPPTPTSFVASTAYLGGEISR
jgi:hypothetical protein